MVNIYSENRTGLHSPTPRWALRGVKIKWYGPGALPICKRGLAGPCELKSASEEQSDYSPHPPSSPSLEELLPCLPHPQDLLGTRDLYTARSQPGPPTAAGGKGRAAEQVLLVVVGVGVAGPSPQAEAHISLPVDPGSPSPKAQVDKAEQRPTCLPQRPQAGLSSPNPSTLTQECPFEIDIEK